MSSIILREFFLIVCYKTDKNNILNFTLVNETIKLISFIAIQILLKRFFTAFNDLTDQFRKLFYYEFWFIPNYPSIFKISKTIRAKLVRRTCTLSTCTGTLSRTSLSPIVPYVAQLHLLQIKTRTLPHCLRIISCPRRPLVPYVACKQLATSIRVTLGRVLFTWPRWLNGSGLAPPCQSHPLSRFYCVYFRGGMLECSCKIGVKMRWGSKGGS